MIAAVPVDPRPSVAVPEALPIPHLLPLPTARESYLVWKRRLDIVLAGILLVLTAPLLLLAVVLTKLTSRGPVFYTQTRFGRNGQPFLIYKVRTMVPNCESRTGACWSPPGDPRVTRVGRFLRKTKLDELPQLWNIFRGDMSLIGPRPERPEFISGLSLHFSRYFDRLQVPQGLTGLAQVQLPADTDLESVRRKLVYDLYYVENLSLGLDLRILIGTGLYLLQVPFPLIRVLLGFPNERGVEPADESLEDTSVDLPVVNPV